MIPPQHKKSLSLKEYFQNTVDANTAIGLATKIMSSAIKGRDILFILVKYEDKDDLLTILEEGCLDENKQTEQS